MSGSIIRAMLDAQCRAWDYAFAFGWLYQGIRSYLRGDISRESLTARFAVMELEWSAYQAARDDGMEGHPALVYACSSVHGTDNQLPAGRPDSPAQGSRELPPPGTALR